MAEVQASTDAFRRLVIVEDKLGQNAQSRRDVLAQVLDYSRTFEQIGDSELGELPERHQKWAKEYGQAIAVSAQRRDFLLLICGDEIDDGLLDLVNRFATRQTLTDLTDIAVLELAIFANGSDRIFIPHVVGGTRVTGRDLVLRVVVEGVDRKPYVVKQATLAENTGRSTGRSPTRTPAEFWAAWARAGSPNAELAWNELVDALQGAGIRNLETANYEGGAPWIRLTHTAIGDPPVLRLSDPPRSETSEGQPFLNDKCNDDAWEDAEEARDEFRNSLGKIGFTVTGKAGRCRRRLPTNAAERAPLVEAVRRLAAALRPVS
jgi:hypothetical protein